MATLKEKIIVEAQVRELLAQNGLPEPDGVEYGFGCIRLYFEGTKTVLVVDIDDPEENRGEQIADSLYLDIEDPADDEAGYRPVNGDDDGIEGKRN